MAKRAHLEGGEGQEESYVERDPRVQRGRWNDVGDEGEHDKQQDRHDDVYQVVLFENNVSKP